MPNWTAFAGFASVVLFALLVLSRASQRLVTGGHETPHGEAGGETSDRRRGGSPTPDGVGAETDAGDAGVDSHVAAGEPPSTTNLLLNVAVSQGVFAAFLVLGAWYAEIPASALGVGAADARTLAVGVGVGVALYVVNEIGSTVGERFGLGGSEALREALAPESVRGWALLLLVVLPVIAGFEELLFRGVLVGALSAGFAVSPWTMVGVSSVAFALGHGAQGPGGVVVTGALGVVLAAVFVLSGSLLVVVVAHYLVNALEFVVHEALDVEWA
ncbi:CPBP family intramembrane glutamic endopeptidase [Haloplanus sp. GCM10025708]|uniref:CPBP family intramembrane glutamic endopeptidase n=1 Tax=Haloferacaceae TaxID=1644056 RepID=UPI00360F5A58